METTFKICVEKLRSPHEESRTDFNVPSPAAAPGQRETLWWYQQRLFFFRIDKKQYIYILFSIPVCMLRAANVSRGKSV